MSHVIKSDSEGDDSDVTIRPNKFNLGLSYHRPKSSLSASISTILASPVESSPCSSNGDGLGYQHRSRSSYAGSDAGTVFSEESCPSLTNSTDTVIYTDYSSRSSVASTGSSRSRNKYPTIVIPRESWNPLDEPVREATIYFGSDSKVPLTPQALSALPQGLSSVDMPPSLSSRSPSMPTNNSASTTPDLRNLTPARGQAWADGLPEPLSAKPLEIALDEDPSILISPAEERAPRPLSGMDRTSINYASDYSTDWSDMVVHFPKIPGATPIETTPIEPDIRGFKASSAQSPIVSSGVQLPSDAMALLQTLTRSYSPSASSSKSMLSRMQEMAQCDGLHRVARTADELTPAVSDYSFSQLSIPSPGGFFSSLHANSRATWMSATGSKRPSAPTSAVAEDFYGAPWSNSPSVKETTFHLPGTPQTDGPPTARQAEFCLPNEHKHEIENVEDSDMYGSGQTQSAPVAPKRSPGYEYEETYEKELKHAAEANIDRTSNWLSAQTSYLSALRETNPLNDPADYDLASPWSEEEEEHRDGVESPSAKAIRFLEQASKVATPVEDVFKSPRSPQRTEPVFVDAFHHHQSNKSRTDSFLQASARLDRVNTERLALPFRHVHHLLNIHSTKSIKEYIRPKYRGPCHLNPRSSGHHTMTPEQTVFTECERQQSAADGIASAGWSLTAQQQILYQGRLTSSSAAERMLAKKCIAFARGTKRHPPRILDLGGSSTGSWAWAAAGRWPQAKIITARANSQANPMAHVDVEAPASPSSTIQPQNPPNHTVTTVAALWRLPYEDNTFDLVSARKLHMYLHVGSISSTCSVDEWELTLRECLRVLRPGGYLDFLTMDSSIATNVSSQRPGMTHMVSAPTVVMATISPSASIGQSSFAGTTPLTNTHSEFTYSLKRNGVDASGGTETLLSRLNAIGFNGTKRQWLALPVGPTYNSHTDPHAAYVQFAREAKSDFASFKNKLNTGSLQSKASIRSASRVPFPPPLRPVSEVSTISGIVDEYSDKNSDTSLFTSKTCLETDAGPETEISSGSTSDISAMTGLVGAQLWEEWVVRHRIDVLRSQDPIGEIDVSALLSGVHDTLAAAYSRGGYFRCLAGYTRKPSSRKEVPQTEKLIQLKHDDSARVDNAEAEKLAVDQYTSVSEYHLPAIFTLGVNLKSNSSSNSISNHGLRLNTSLSLLGFNPSHTRSGHDNDNSGLSLSPPQRYTQSAIDRGDVGEIPVMMAR